MKGLAPVLDGGTEGVTLSPWKASRKTVEVAVDELYRSLLGARRVPHVRIVVPPRDFTEDTALVAEFTELADRWQRETAAESFMTRKALHDDYQSIIGMGRPAVPLILRRLQEHGGHWFWALHAITREDPAAHTDSISDAAEAWLRWGRERDLV